MKATPNEIKLLKEYAIAEYKLKTLNKLEKKKTLYQDFVTKLRRIIPINIFVGLIASLILVYVNGWRTLVYLLLSGIIWLTLISTLVSAFLNKDGK